MYDVNKLIYDLRGTAFHVGDQIVYLNDSMFGMKKFPNDRLIFLINQAGMIVQAALKEDRQIAHNHLLTYRDTIALPDDLMFLQEVRVYEDYIENEAEGTATSAGSNTTLNDSAAAFTASMVGMRVDNETDGSSGIITSVQSATQIVCSAGLSAGSDNTFSSGDSYAIYNHLQSTSRQVTDALSVEFAASDEKLVELRPVGSLSGFPQRYSFYEARGTNSPLGARFIVFDVKPDQKYFFDVYYYPTAPALTATSQSPYMATQYQELLFLKLCELVALRLGDTRRKQEFKQDYGVAFAEYMRLLGDQYTPIAPIYRTLGI